MSDRFRVVVAGGGVAALEGVLALRELAGDRVEVTLLACAPDFVYRPMRVGEPFAFPLAERFCLEDIARDLGITLQRGAFSWLDPGQRLVHVEGGGELPYDALLLALGAQRTQRYRHALTLDDARLDEQLHGLIQDIEGGYVRRLAFLIPEPMPWPLPVYELAIMSARRGWEAGLELTTTVVTPEQRPLAIFGDAASAAVSRLLASYRVAVLAGARSATPTPGQVVVYPGERSLAADRIVALPGLAGVATPGVPKSTAGGFVPIDAMCRVRGLDAVFAAGDLTDYPIKMGGIAAQQADVAAAAIAELAGAPVRAQKFQPTLNAMLLGADAPLYLSARVSGSRGVDSHASETALWSPPDKIAARYLAPYLRARREVQSGRERLAPR